MDDDLVAFLVARFDEDERAARESGQPSLSWKNFDMDGELRDDCNAGTVAYVPRDDTRAYISRFDPARVLAEVAAKRELIKRGDTLFCSCDERNPPMDPETNWTVPIPHHYDCTAYRIAQVLATAYQDHLGYREEWKP